MYQTLEVKSGCTRGYAAPAAFDDDAGLHEESLRIKVLLYSHDTFGLGHLRRNLAIADRLLSHPQPFSVLLLTGSPVIKKWKLPAGLKVQPLPPVVKTGAEQYVSRDDGHVFGLIKGYREALILKTVLRFRPDILLVDHAPAGMNGELLSTLALIRREFPAMRTVLGLRDILDSPEVVRQVWREQDIHALLDQAYDDVFVYGSRSLIDVAASYGLTGRIAGRVRYCGYVVAAGGLRDLREPHTQGSPCWDPERAGERPVILVTAGGGGDGFFLMEAFLQAQAQSAALGCHSVIVTGPLMPEEQKVALRALSADRSDVEVVDHTTDLVPSLQAAHLVISMAGYNTSAEIIAARRRAILVPRAAPRAEQLIRARLLESLGVVRSVEPSANLACELAKLLPVAVSGAPPAGTAWAALDLGGAGNVVELLQDMTSSLRDCAA